jgi:hypothetical protein
MSVRKISKEQFIEQRFTQAIIGITTTPKIGEPLIVLFNGNAFNVGRVISASYAGPYFDIFHVTTSLSYPGAFNVYGDMDAELPPHPIAGMASWLTCPDMRSLDPPRQVS